MASAFAAGSRNKMDVNVWLKDRKIGVLYGGRSAEREISILSGRAVLTALKKLKFRAVGIDAATNLPFKLKSNKIDFVYNALHGPWGEDGTVQGLLEIMGIPYSGCGVLSSALAMNKVFSKRMFKASGVPTPEWQTVVKNSAAPKITRFPVVVKPAAQGSAIGVTIAENKKELPAAYRKAFRFDKTAVVERYITGTEITVGILGGKILPAVEIVPDNKFYDFEAKYKKGKSKHIIPPRLPAAVIKKAQSAALKAFNALGCRAVSRVDIIVDAEGRPWVLEVNTIPGMTETSLLPDAARAAGMSFDKLLLEIIKYSLKAL
jgi:D-alanine-D-alanine ligase